VIINFPTGLYNLPKKPSDNTSVTFTISNGPPPRSNLLFSKVPVGVERRQRIPGGGTIFTRRAVVGELVFTVSKTGPSTPQTNMKTFDTGTILEFGVDRVLAVEPMLVPALTEIQHNVSSVEYQSMGFTEAEIAQFDSMTLQAFDTITTELNAAKQRRANAEVAMETVQKVINQLTRALETLQITKDLGGDADALIAKLTTQLDELVEQRTVAIAVANEASLAARTLNDQLHTVGQMLK